MSKISDFTLILNKIVYRIRLKFGKLFFKNTQRKSRTILANNCISGVISHDLNWQFKSPTINLFTRADDFITMLEHFPLSFEVKIEELHENGINNPLGLISLPNNKTAKINFLHYKTFDEANDAWVKRSKRISTDNMKIIIIDNCDITDADMERFLGLPFDKKMIVFDKSKYEFLGKENAYLFETQDSKPINILEFKNTIIPLGNRIYKDRPIIKWILS